MPDSADPPPPPLPGEIRRYATTELFGDSREIEIEHKGEIYRLRITQRSRLILTK